MGARCSCAKCPKTPKPVGVLYKPQNGNDRVEFHTRGGLVPSGDLKDSAEKVMRFAAPWMQAPQLFHLGGGMEVFTTSEMLLWRDWVDPHPEAPCVTTSPQEGDSPYQCDFGMNGAISLIRADTRQLKVDAIVNSLGVSGAIFRAAGSQMDRERAMVNGCEEGRAKVTPGHALPASNVIHTVGPQYRDPEVLAACYRSCLDMVKKHRFKTVAFPYIATGLYGFSLQEATRIALRTVREWMEREKGRKGYLSNLERIIFCLYDENSFRVYKELLEVYFPQKPKPDINQGG